MKEASYDFRESETIELKEIYIRQGYSSAPATNTAIRRMIKETDGDHFEEMRSLEQELTFEAAEKEFEHRNIDLGPQQMQTLKILNNDGIYTNLGLLLSEQCVHTIKAAVFQGTDQSIFKDRHEFTGSLMRQLNEVYDFIDFRNQTHSTFDKLLRIDTRDYPEVAVREALLNLLVHRDYAFRASALISIYIDRIEFVSVGGLLPGIDLEDKITLPNVNARYEAEESTEPKTVSSLNENENKVLQLFDLLKNLDEWVGCSKEHPTAQVEIILNK